MERLFLVVVVLLEEDLDLVRTAEARLGNALEPFLVLGHSGLEVFLAILVVLDGVHSVDSTLVFETVGAEDGALVVEELFFQTTLEPCHLELFDLLGHFHLVLAFLELLLVLV